MFSKRSAWDLTPNRFARLLAEKRARGGRVLDLTASNPTRCGFQNPGMEALEALRDPASLRYDPDPRGRREAREAVAQYYAERGVAVGPDRIVLTASTSEAYGYLLKLLTDPGDLVLVPRPGYPLLDYLARLEAVHTRTYGLDLGTRWELDPGSLGESVLGTRARVIVAVSPSNPTGWVLREPELVELERVAAEHQAALVCDEVFADFPLEPDLAVPVAAARAREALCVSLSGISKVCGLPQLKLGWMVVGGPENQARAALARLEVIADTYLSAATPVQVALGKLLGGRRGFLSECRERLRQNLASLGEQVARRPDVRLLPAAAGWYACLRVPRVGSEEDLVLRLLEKRQVAVHPGYFFDFDEEAYLVLSLLPPRSEFDEAVALLLEEVG